MAQFRPPVDLLHLTYVPFSSPLSQCHNGVAQKYTCVYNTKRLPVDTTRDRVDINTNHHHHHHIDLWGETKQWWTLWNYPWTCSGGRRPGKRSRCRPLASPSLMLPSLMSSGPRLMRTASCPVRSKFMWMWNRFSNWCLLFPGFGVVDENEKKPLSATAATIGQNKKDDEKERSVSAEDLLMELIELKEEGKLLVGGKGLNLVLCCKDKTTVIRWNSWTRKQRPTWFERFDSILKQEFVVKYF